MTSFDYRLNPIYAIKECATCGVLYTADFCCSKKGLEDKILVPKPPRNCARCARCGTPVDGPYCQGCALLRKKFKEDLFTYCVENEFFEDLQDTSESSDDNTNVVNAPQEPFVGNQDPGENSSLSPPHIDHCCHECGDSLDGIFCQQCTCKSCGEGAHYGYNCPPKVPIISNPELPNNQTIDELPQSVQQQFQPPQYTVNHPIFNSQNELLNSSNKLMEQMATLCDLVGQAIQKKEEEKRIAEEQASKDQYWKIPICYDDDEDDTITKSPSFYQSRKHDNFSKSWGTSTLTSYSRMKRIGEFISMYSVEDLIPNPCESEGIPDKMCDVPLCENTTPLNALNEHSEIVVNSDDDNSSSDDDSPYGEDIDYVDASPPDVEIVSLEVREIVERKLKGLMLIFFPNNQKTILRENIVLNVNFLMLRIDALKRFAQDCDGHSAQRFKRLCRDIHSASHEVADEFQLQTSITSLGDLVCCDISPAKRRSRNGYLRKGRKTKPNRTKPSTEMKRAEKSKVIRKVNPDKVKVN
ncbi:hypothetical protein Tco_0538040 [Tanacetum coccineum]